MNGTNCEISKGTASESGTPTRLDFGSPVNLQQRERSFLFTLLSDIASWWTEISRFVLSRIYRIQQVYQSISSIHVRKYIGFFVFLIFDAVLLTHQVGILTRQCFIETQQCLRSKQIKFLEPWSASIGSCVCCMNRGRSVNPPLPSGYFSDNMVSESRHYALLIAYRSTVFLQASIKVVYRRVSTTSLIIRDLVRDDFLALSDFFMQERR